MYPTEREKLFIAVCLRSMHRNSEVESFAKNSHINSAMKKNTEKGEF
jgi:hypothetical protein